MYNLERDRRKQESGSLAKTKPHLTALPPTSPALVLRAQDHHIYLDDGREILDACGGAGVTCLGHDNQEVLNAMNKQSQAVSYVPYSFFGNQSSRNLADFLTRTSNGVLTKAYIVSSGSEAMDGAMKLAREYFVWKNEPQRINFIARKPSYHGATLATLSLGGHTARRAPFEPLLLGNSSDGTESDGTERARHTRVEHVPICNAYREQGPGELDAAFIARKAAELEEAFQRLGPETVCAFVVEPLGGAAAGCVPAVPGYLAAMKAVCVRHGALFVLDEIMCGMGRTGTLHAWQHDMELSGQTASSDIQKDAAPDIQAVGKGLAGGFQPCAAILVGKRVMDAMQDANASFTHGHTFLNHPVASAAAYAVQTVIRREALLINVRARGEQLGEELHVRLDHHPNVGNIRGRGLFWGIEFVRDRATKEPFDAEEQIAQRIHERAMSARFQLLVYPGQGCVDGSRGDHIMLMPAYTVTDILVTTMVDTLADVIETFFEEWQK